ncbi:MAG: 1-deoxy-D-xylulose-5-phosphate reductoisomerase [Candidatus Omnitrophota bacterium]
MRRVAILGSTGSIGVNTLKVLESLKGGFSVEALSTFENTRLLAQQIRQYKPKAVVVVNPEKISDLKKRVSLAGIKVFSTQVGNEILAESKNIDTVVVAISGSCALNPILSAIRTNKKICLANKEALVMAGNIIMRMVKKYKAVIVPVDSEHSAIFQCIRQNKDKAALSRIYLTGSGGPLKDVPKKEFPSLTMSRILKHPRWKMGPKITVDSATLMNKGLEVIEAKHLFDIPANRINVVIHPEAVVHSMVEFTDGSILAQMAATDMRLPIQYAMTFPNRVSAPLATLNFNKTRQLNFSQPDLDKFPCLELANVACKLGGTYPAVINAADEVTVYAYLDGKIKFTDIPKTIEKVMLNHKYIADPLLNDILAADAWARQQTRTLIS